MKLYANKILTETLANLEFQLKDARALDFNEEFDAAISVFCLHWIPSVQEMMDTMKGIAKPQTRWKVCCIYI